jgi:hypothetical protein
MSYGPNGLPTPNQRALPTTATIAAASPQAMGGGMEAICVQAVRRRAVRQSHLEGALR